MRVMAFLVAWIVSPEAAFSDASIGDPGRVEEGRWVGVASRETHPERIVVWDERHIQMSSDGGASFSLVLEEGDAVAGAALGDDGTIFAIRAPGRLGKRAPDGSESWRNLPASDGDWAIAAGAGLVAWVSVGAGEVRAAVSTDGGRHFHRRKLRDAVNWDVDGKFYPCGCGDRLWGDRALAISVEPDGTVFLLGSEPSCPDAEQWLYKTQDGRTWRSAPIARAALDQPTLGAGGAVVGVTLCDDDYDKRCLYRDQRELKRVPYHDELETPTDGAWRVSDGKLLRRDATGWRVWPVAR
jgi:hypothetical protein